MKNRIGTGLLLVCLALTFFVASCSSKKAEIASEEAPLPPQAATDVLPSSEPSVETVADASPTPEETASPMPAPSRRKRRRIKRTSAAVATPAALEESPSPSPSSSPSPSPVLTMSTPVPPPVQAPVSRPVYTPETPKVEEAAQAEEPFYQRKSTLYLIAVLAIAGIAFVFMRRGDS